MVFLISQSELIRLISSKTQSAYKMLERHGIRTTEPYGVYNIAYTRRGYYLRTALGLMVGDEIYRSKRGCNANYVKDIVDSFLTLTDDDLDNYISNGLNHFIHSDALINGKLVLHKGPAYDFINVEPHYNILIELKNSKVQFEQPVQLLKGPQPILLPESISVEQRKALIVEKFKAKIQEQGKIGAQ